MTFFWETTWEINIFFKNPVPRGFFWAAGSSWRSLVCRMTTWWNATWAPSFGTRRPTGMAFWMKRPTSVARKVKWKGEEMIIICLVMFGCFYFQMSCFFVGGSSVSWSWTSSCKSLRLCCLRLLQEAYASWNRQRGLWQWRGSCKGGQKPGAAGDVWRKVTIISSWLHKILVDLF